ncbi:MAG: iron-sulfur cluster assembly scaffold protein [Erythrobacter sp.]
MAETTNASSSKLYTPQLLWNATLLANYPLRDELTNRAEARSRTCGSMIVVGAELDDDGKVESIGMQVTACAIGQASAAILATGAEGCSIVEFRKVLTETELWLAGEGPLPAWHGFEKLEPALPHTGRHGALLLPWKAAVEALSSPASTG